MGQTLIIENADWTENGLPIEYPILLIQKGLVLLNNINFGTTSQTNIKRLSSSKAILVRNGETITISGLRGINSNKEVLHFDYCYYTDDTISHNSVVGSYSNFDSSKYFSLNIEERDSCSIENTLGQDYYFVFGFASATKDVDIPVDDYSLYYSIE